MDEEYFPIMITYDPIIDMWSYYVGDHSGVADTKTELIDKVWQLLYNYEHGYYSEEG